MYPADYNRDECQADVGVMGYMGCNCSSCTAKDLKSCEPSAKKEREEKQEYGTTKRDPYQSYSLVQYEELCRETTKALQVKLPINYRGRKVLVWIPKTLSRDHNKDNKTVHVYAPLWSTILRDAMQRIATAGQFLYNLEQQGIPNKEHFSGLVGKEFVVHVKKPIALCPYCGGTDCDCGRGR